MGLHLNYEFRLAPDTPRDEARRMLGALRDFATTLPIDMVFPFADLSLLGPGDDPGDAAWLVFHANCLADPMPGDELPRYIGDPRTAVGFMVHPGEGSETATFALMRRRPEAGGDDEWFWWCACKTQYASTVSDEHLIRVHTALVAVLDEAIRMGFDVVVRDETGYWESRSTSQLLDAVGSMNRVIAKFAGALSDQIGHAHDVRAPIFLHREFEHLEMEKPKAPPD